MFRVKHIEDAPPGCVWRFCAASRHPREPELYIVCSYDEVTNNVVFCTAKDDKEYNYPLSDWTKNLIPEMVEGAMELKRLKGILTFLNAIPGVKLTNDKIYSMLVELEI